MYAVPGNYNPQKAVQVDQGQEGNLIIMLFRVMAHCLVQLVTFWYTEVEVNAN